MKWPQVRPVCLVVKATSLREACKRTTLTTSQPERIGVVFGSEGSRSLVLTKGRLLRMAKITAPLLSFGASGSIANTQTYSRWKGVPYVRQKVTPSNPKTTEQTLTRNTFTFLNSVWKVAPSDFQAAWKAAVKGRALTDRNLWLSKNNGTLRSLSDLTGLIMSPGAGGGLIGSITVTPGNDLVTIAGTPPDPLPSGWSVVRLIGAAIRQQDPQSGQLFDIVVGSDSSDPYTFDLTGLASAEHYMAAGWFEYQKSALATDLAYGPATAVDVLTT